MSFAVVVRIWNLSSASESKSVAVNSWMTDSTGRAAKTFIIDGMNKIFCDKFWQNWKKRQHFITSGYGYDVVLSCELGHKWAYSSYQNVYRNDGEGSWRRNENLRVLIEFSLLILQKFVPSNQIPGRPSWFRPCTGARPFDCLSGIRYAQWRLNCRSISTY